MILSIKKTVLISSLFVSSFLPILSQTNENSNNATENNKEKTLIQTIKGEVRDLQTQQAIIGATIQILPTKMGTVSKSDGSFKISKVPVGRYTVSVKAIGYEPSNNNVILSSGKEIILNIQLNPKYVRTGEIEVVASKNQTTINESALISTTVFNVDDLERYAGARNDPARFAQTFAGVLGNNDQRNDIIIRGGSPIELLWKLDGLDIPNPNHFATQGATGGPISVLNSRILDNSDFMTGAFPAEYTGKMSGAFDLRTRKGNKEKFEYMGQFGFNGFEGGIEGPISSNSSFIANYRYSFLDVIEKLGVDLGWSGTPKYQDATLKYNWDIDENNQIALIGLYGTSDIDIKESKKSDVWTGDFDIKNGTDIYVLGLSWQNLLSTKAFGKLTVAVNDSKYRTHLDSITTDANHKVLSLSPWVNNSSSEGYFTAKYDFNYAMDKNNLFKAGLEIRNQNYNLYEKRETVDWDAKGQYIQDQSGSAMYSKSYVNWNWRISQDLTSNIGLSSQYLAISKKSSIEPRISLAYKLDDNQTLSLGFGIHKQALPLSLYFTKPAEQVEYQNTNLDFMQSIHYVAGYTANISNDLMLKSEFYYKDLSSIPIDRDKSSAWSLVNSGTSFGGLDVEGKNVKSSGTGRTYGAEFTLMKHFSDGYYFTGTASYIRQQYTASDNITRWGGFDNQFILNLLAGYEYKLSDNQTMEFSAKYTIAGGNPYTSVNLAESQKINRTIYSDNAFDQRMQNYQRLDIRIDFRNNYDGFALISYISIENALNTKNVLYYYYDAKNQKVDFAPQIGIFPLGGFRIEF